MSQCATSPFSKCCLSWYADHRHLHSFPTRRSSDLTTRVDSRAFACDATLPLSDWVELRGEFFSGDRKSTRLNSSHTVISYAVFCLKKKNRASIRFSAFSMRSFSPGVFSTYARSFI